VSTCVCIVLTLTSYRCLMPCASSLLLLSTSAALFFSFFFFNDPATTEIYTLSLHDALPIHLRCAIGHASLSHGFSDAGSALEAVDRKSTRLNSSHVKISYAVFCLKKKKNNSIAYNK